jgi:uncharacterized protein YciI
MTSARTRRLLSSPAPRKLHVPERDRPGYRLTSVKYVLFYESADDVLSKAPAHFPAHKARFDDFHARGELLMVGTFGDPQEEGSMAIFTTREAAEEFVREDPFVLHGVVRDWHIREWDEVLSP